MFQYSNLDAVYKMVNEPPVVGNKKRTFSSPFSLVKAIKLTSFVYFTTSK